MANRYTVPVSTSADNAAVLSGEPAGAGVPATSARFVVAGWLCGLSCILYLDRICMAQAVKPIRDELRLFNTQASYVAMAFTLAYGLCAVPSGRWLDKSGPRAV